MEASKLIAREVAAKARNFVDNMATRSVMPPHRPVRIRELLRESALTGKPATIVNWICPAGTPLEVDSAGQISRRYVGVDPQIGYERDYRLSPSMALERGMLSMFDDLGLPAPNYIKIVADD